VIPNNLSNRASQSLSITLLSNSQRIPKKHVLSEQALLLPQKSTTFPAAFLSIAKVQVDEQKGCTAESCQSCRIWRHEGPECHDIVMACWFWRGLKGREMLGENGVAASIGLINDLL